MSKVLIYSQEDLDLILELEKEKNEELQQENEKLKADYGTKVQVERDLLKEENKILRENAENNDKVVDKVNWENQLLKKQLEDYKYSHSCSFVDTCKNVKIANFNQQKEFIEYMNKTIEELEYDNVDDEEMKAYLIQRIDTFKEILQKYKTIIGDDKQ